jgi:hypothetical protein
VKPTWDSFAESPPFDRDHRVEPFGQTFQVIRTLDDRDQVGRDLAERRFSWRHSVDRNPSRCPTARPSISLLEIGRGP